LVQSVAFMIATTDL